MSAQDSSGPVVAFFDLDNTLINTSSGILYYRYLLRLGEIQWTHFARLLWWFFQHRINRLDVEAIVARETERYRGMEESRITEHVDSWFAEYVKPRIFREAIAAVDEHRTRGERPVILSAASPYVCRPMSEHMGFEHYLCTVPVVEDGAFNGDFHRPYCYGKGKVTWAERYAAEHGVDLDDAYFYSDSLSDMPLLTRIGKPRVVNPDPHLRREAMRRGWPILRWSRPIGAESHPAEVSHA